MILKAHQTMTDLMSNFPKHGKLEWIGISTAVRTEIKSLDTATLIADTGIEGDHRAKRTGGKRQVTLIQENIWMSSLPCVIGKSLPSHYEETYRYLV